MSGTGDWLGGLRDQVQQTIAGNALALTLSAARKAVDPARQWWNLPAKYAAADQIKAEMLHRFKGWNNAGDAMRHAELSRRMAADIDPLTSLAAGLTHEAENALNGQPGPEGAMDVHNNFEGIRAAVLGRPVDPASLQTRPIYPPPGSSPYDR